MYLNVGCTVLTCELHCSWLGNPVLNTGHLIFLFFGFLLRTPCCATDKAPFELELVIFFGFVIGFGSFSGGLGTGFDSNLSHNFSIPFGSKIPDFREFKVDLPFSTICLFGFAGTSFFLVTVVYVAINYKCHVLGFQDCFLV